MNQPTNNESKSGISTADDRSSVTLTIYNDGLALVQDDRKVKGTSPVEKLEWRDVSSGIQSASVILKGASAQQAVYDYDLLNLSSLYKKHVGVAVTLVFRSDELGQEGPSEVRERIVLLAVDDSNLVIQRASGLIETLNIATPNMRIVFDSVPETLKVTPTLSFEGVRQNSDELSLTYLSTGFRWESDYVAVLGKDTFHLQAYVTLKNDSATDFMNTNLRLLAGNVHRTSHRGPVYEVEDNMEVHSYSMDFDDSPAIKNESIEGFELYTVPFSVDLKRKQQRQIELFRASDISFKRLVKANGYFGSRSSKPVEMSIEFDNTEESGLGMAMPKGTVRIYSPSEDGTNTFVGEDYIPHTGEEQTVTLQLGEAFGITAEQFCDELIKESDRVQRYIGQGWKLINGEEYEVTLTLVERIFSSDYESDISFDDDSDYIPRKVMFDRFEHTVTLAPHETREIRFNATVTKAKSKEKKK